MATATVTTLRDLRVQQKKTASQLVDFLQGRFNEGKRRDVTSIYQMEADGTDKYSMIAALAEFYGTSIPEMAAISSPKNNRKDL